MKDVKIKFPSVPLYHKPLKMVIPDIDIPIPLNSGHICHLIIPANYNKYDLKIIETVITSHFTYMQEANNEMKKSALGQYINRVVKKKTIIDTHF